MSASLQLYKYVGKDGTFGTPVTNIGIKRIDAAVPAVYQSTSSGNTVTPSNDMSDANTYCIYRPDDVDDTNYSYETVFKLLLKDAPSNQLSNIRIYPDGDKPTDDNFPILYIGNSKSYSRPTNIKSTKAINNIWNYTKENPFYLTVNNKHGQYIDEKVSNLSYNITVHDIGVGNLIYLNNERQIDIPIVVGNSYQFVDKTDGLITFTLFDPSTNEAISSDSDNITITTIDDERVVTLIADATLLSNYPNGLRYGDVNNENIGYTISWIDLSVSPITTIEYNVEIKELLNGVRLYYLNGEKNPVINFEENKIYKFININGDTDPLRFLNNSKSITANTENELVLDGISVENGGTVNEIITVNASEVAKSGNYIRSYQSVYNAGYGNRVTNIQPFQVGYYNLNTVNGGIYNPLAAGETDYVYMQLEVKGTSILGQNTPNLIIEYDES